MKLYEKENVPYLLVLMDGYNTYLSVYPLENMKSSDVARVSDCFLLITFINLQVFHRYGCGVYE